MTKRFSLQTSVLWLLLALFCFATPQTFAKKKKQKEQPSSGMVIATDYMTPDTLTDVTDALQRLIDENPNRTIYLPDGTYCVSRSILTPAHPLRSVHLVLANYAKIKAIGPWTEGGAVVRLGAKDKANDIRTPGSNYGFTGGIIDGSGVADGISIDGGRETRIMEVSIKHVRIGVHIKHGANGGSSDSDIENINIVGNDTPQSIGVLVEGFDNTIRNMRIASVNVGVWVKSGGNSLRDIHPLYIQRHIQDYPSSIGFRIDETNNWLSFCYSDQMATAFQLGRGVEVHLTDCFCYWYSGKTPFQRFIATEGPLNSVVIGPKVQFHNDCPDVTYLVAEPGGHGHILFPSGHQNRPVSNPADAWNHYIVDK